MSSSQKHSLSIELLPEFGWSIKDQPVYGPGSVFQGFVKLNSANLPIERVRLAFYASETIPQVISHATGCAYSKENTLFSVQSSLWDSKGGSLTLDPATDYTFSFTIQMPMVQFPPSFEHDGYKCRFQLIALIDAPKCDTPLIRTSVPVICMPFVETSLLKVPLVLDSQKGDLSAQVHMGVQEFVPGDFIPISLRVEKIGGSTKKKSNSLQYVTVQLKLDQVVSFKDFNSISDQSKTVTSTTVKLPLIPDRDIYSCCGDLTLPLPFNISPSYDYGKLIKVAYKLNISVEQKGPFCGIWSYFANIQDIDITIGTLGYGIRTSNEIRLYSEELITNVPSERPTPKFMKNIEYEDALPLYDPSKLPDYEHFIPKTIINY